MHGLWHCTYVQLENAVWQQVQSKGGWTVQGITFSCPFPELAVSSWFDGEFYNLSVSAAIA